MTTFRFRITLLVTFVCLSLLWGTGNVVVKSFSPTVMGTVVKVTADQSFVAVAGVGGVDGQHIAVLTGADRKDRELGSKVPMWCDETTKPASCGAKPNSTIWLMVVLSSLFAVLLAVVMWWPYITPLFSRKETPAAEPL